MQASSQPLPLTPREQAWARVVECYAGARLPAARSALGADSLASFAAFLALWRGRFQLDDPPSSQHYRGMSHESRRALYERFLRQCRSWESTLRIARPPAGALATPSPGSPGSRLRELAEREERARAFHEQLVQRIQRDADGLSLPRPVREAYRVLGVAPGSPLHEVRAAYRGLARTHHPDHRGDAATMMSVSHAYRYLMRYHRAAGTGTDAD